MFKEPVFKFHGMILVYILGIQVFSLFFGAPEYWSTYWAFDVWSALLKIYTQTANRPLIYVFIQKVIINM